MRFSFSSAVYDLGVRGIYYNIRGAHNLASDDARVLEYVNRQLQCVPEELDQSEAIRGFEALHAAVSNKPSKLISAPANLLSFFRAKNDIPRINGIVDVYNSISITTGIAVGAHDLAHVTGDIELRLTRGDEYFLPLGASKPFKVPPGEYGYIDSGNDILCRLEVRQVEKTKVTMKSTDIFFIVQGHRSLDPLLIHRAGDELAATCLRIFGGNLEKLYP